MGMETRCASAGNVAPDLSARRGMVRAHQKRRTPMGQLPTAANRRSFDALRREIESYLGKSDDSSPASFSDVASQYPSVLIGSGDLATGMADFAEIGYCLYKSW